MCNPCQEGHHHAQRHPAGMLHSWRDLNSCLSPSSQHPGPFQGKPIPPKGINLKKLLNACYLLFYYFYYSATIKVASYVLPHKPICQIYILCLPPLLLYNNLSVPPLMPPDPAYKNNSGIKTHRQCTYSCSNSQKFIYIRIIFILSVVS